jgi:hypothetical protein
MVLTVFWVIVAVPVVPVYTIPETPVCPVSAVLADALEILLIRFPEIIPDDVLLNKIPAAKLAVPVPSAFRLAIVLPEMSGGVVVLLEIEANIPYTNCVPVLTVPELMLLAVVVLPITLPVMVVDAVDVACIPYTPAPTEVVEPSAVIAPTLLFWILTILGVAADVLIPTTAGLDVVLFVFTIALVPVVAPMVLPITSTLPSVTKMPLSKPEVPLYAIFVIVFPLTVEVIAVLTVISIPWTVVATLLLIVYVPVPALEA